MRAVQTINLIAAILWSISAVYLVYKYALNAGYWEHPLYITLFFYLVILLSKKGLTKLNIFIFFFYIAFGIWLFLDLFLHIVGVFSIN